MRKSNLIPAFLAVLPFVSANHAMADQAQCEADARTAMLDVRHPIPMRQHFTTTMGDSSIKSMALTTPENHGMAMDENGVPTSLWIGRKFYTTTDQGKTWKLLSESTPEAEEAFFDGLQSQADEATNIMCQYDVDLDGKRVDHYSLDYVLYNTGMEMHGEYWVDADTEFPWRIETVSPHNTIVQNNVPEPDAKIPDPKADSFRIEG